MGQDGLSHPAVIVYFGGMVIADEIVEVVRRRSGLTELEIARNIYGRAASQQQVNSICRRLVAESRLVREGKGGWGNEFTYHLPKLRRP
jgi:hypothetical protein